MRKSKRFRLIVQLFLEHRLQQDYEYSDLQNLQQTVVEKYQGALSSVDKCLIGTSYGMGELDRDAKSCEEGFLDISLPGIMPKYKIQNFVK